MSEGLLALMRRLSPRVITTLGLFSLLLLFSACGGESSCDVGDEDYPECLGGTPA